VSKSEVDELRILLHWGDKISEEEVLRRGQEVARIIGRINGARGGRPRRVRKLADAR
jgi:hypothetical protein